MAIIRSFGLRKQVRLSQLNLEAHDQTKSQDCRVWVQIGNILYIWHQGDANFIMIKVEKCIGAV